MKKILFGGDYNPEQWSKEIWDEDSKLFDKADIDTLSVGIFAWSMVQKDEDTYDFTVMDEIMERLHKEGRNICLATGTAAHPAWLARKYPDVTRVDFNGRKHKFGQRHNSCPNSPNYQKYSVKLAEKIAKRYKDYDNIIAWHINNEYGGNCYCENCEKAFRKWLKEKYGTLDKLNKDWNTKFWSHIFYSWEDIVVPNALSEHYGDNPNVTAFQGITLDYMRFNSDSILNNFIAEKKVVKKYTPDIPVTTNLMGMYKPLDYFKWAPYMDFISWDNYPPNMKSQARMALTHDLMRGLKKGKPFWLMEQTPSVTACRSSNPLKAPGVMRLWSYQGIAHGSDSVLFFQMRQSKGASEKYHGAIINHSGRGDTRTFMECEELGRELALLKDELIEGTSKSKVAIYFDWESWWAVEISDGPSRYINYQETIIEYYKALYKENIDIDIINHLEDIKGYKVILAPLMHMVKSNQDKKIKDFVKEGGVFLTTYLSGLVDEHDNAFLMDMPGPFADLLGIRIDETDTQEPEELNSVRCNLGRDEKSFNCNIIFDLIQENGCEVVAKYENNFYKGMPAITKNKYGKGEAWYIGTKIELSLIEVIVKQILEGKDIKGILPFYEGLEVRSRYKNSNRYDFIMNHSDEAVSINIPFHCKSLLDNKELSVKSTINIKAKDVVILKSN